VTTDGLGFRELVVGTAGQRRPRAFLKLSYQLQNAMDLIHPAALVLVNGIDDPARPLVPVLPSVPPGGFEARGRLFEACPLDESRRAKSAFAHASLQGRFKLFRDERLSCPRRSSGKNRSEGEQILSKKGFP